MHKPVVIPSISRDKFYVVLIQKDKSVVVVGGPYADKDAAQDVVDADKSGDKLEVRVGSQLTTYNGESATKSAQVFADLKHGVMRYRDAHAARHAVAAHGEVAKLTAVTDGIQFIVAHEDDVAALKTIGYSPIPADDSVNKADPSVMESVAADIRRAARAIVEGVKGEEFKDLDLWSSAVKRAGLTSQSENGGGTYSAVNSAGAVFGHFSDGYGFLCKTVDDYDSTMYGDDLPGRIASGKNESDDFDPATADMDDPRMIDYWEQAQADFGLDSSFQYTDDQIRRYVKAQLAAADWDTTTEAKDENGTDLGRVVSSHEYRDRKALVYNNREWNEFVVQFYQGGKHMKSADYHGSYNEHDKDDVKAAKEDALATAKSWIAGAKNESEDSEEGELPDGVYLASDLDDEEEVAQAETAAAVLKCDIDDLYAINKMDYINSALDDPTPEGEHLTSTEETMYSATVNGVQVVCSADNIGVFVRKSDLEALNSTLAEARTELPRDAGMRGFYQIPRRYMPKVGDEVDFYAPKTGEKKYGRVKGINGDKITFIPAGEDGRFSGTPVTMTIQYED